MNKKVHRLLSLALVFALAIGTVSQAFAATATGILKQEQLSARQSTQSGNVYYVSTTGKDTNSGSITSPFQTFAKAVSLLKPGDTLWVMPGTYYEPLVLDVAGTQAAPINVIGYGAKLDLQDSERTGIKLGGSHINLSGFEVTGATDVGIGIPGQYITVRNNNVHDNVTENGIGVCGTSGTWPSALKVGVGGENIVIEGNMVYNNCGEGIAITRGVNVIVRNNIAYDNFAPNIYIDNSPHTNVENNLVYCTGARLRRDGKRPSGIGLGEEYYEGWGAQMHDILVIGNTVMNCNVGIGAFKTEVNGTFTNVTITQNYVPSGFARPILLSTSPNKNVVISQNSLFTDPWISDEAGVTLTGNIIGGFTPPTDLSP